MPSTRRPDSSVSTAVSAAVSTVQKAIASSRSAASTARPAPADQAPPTSSLAAAARAVMPGASSFAATGGSSRGFAAFTGDAAGDAPMGAAATRGGASLVAAFAARRADVTPAPGAVAGPVKKAKTRAELDALGKRDDVPGAAGVLAVKFLVTGVDTTKPKVWLMDSNEYAYHWDFATRGLGMQIDLRDFNAQTYFTDVRKNIAGTIVAHDAYVDVATGEQGMYAVEFWPTDPVKAQHVNKAFDLIAKALPFAKGKLAYHPAGDTQEALLPRDAGSFRRMKVPVVTTEQLFQGVTFSPLNQGVGFGILKVADPNDPQQAPATARDVVIFKTLPNDVSHVAGILTETPQTPLSHVNLKAKQNDTPNAYLKDATKDPAIKALVGKIIRYEVTAEGVTMREATKAEADAFLESKRPAHAQHIARDLTKRTIKDLDDLSHKDEQAFGAKTANLGELRNILGAQMVPDGYGIPFSFYDDFMKAAPAGGGPSLYDEARAMIADPTFQADPKVRDEKLAALRKRIKKADVPAALTVKLDALQKKFPVDQPIRCRSSTNNEDLEGFNGAGLYDSYTHRPDEGKLEKTVKQVWASLWNFRAFEERDFWRIDHFEAAMAVTVHPNMDDERANGVAITKNIYDANWPGFYVNVQVGEQLVTNPGPADVPDELLVSAIGPNGEYETQFIRHSSQAKGVNVLSPEQLAELVAAMEKIQAHFKNIYGRGDDATFAMDLEFKIDVSGALRVKQARPVVD